MVFYQKLKRAFFNSRIYNCLIKLFLPKNEKTKQRLVKNIGKKYALRILIETGTYLGNMVEAVKNDFDQIYSIELDPDLFQRAKKRFQKRNHLNILLGDSGRVLPELLRKINQPCLFWLDAHYSGGISAKGSKQTPLLEEMTAILAWHKGGSLILIDDAAWLDNQKEISLANLKNLVTQSQPKLSFKVEEDIIKIS